MSAPFFSPDSYWNTPLPTDPALHPDNDHFLDLTRWSLSGTGLRVNLHKWTIPVYDVDAATPLHSVARRMADEETGQWFLANSRPYLHPGHPLGHHADFGPAIPIPEAATPDGQSDAHIALIDRHRRLGWDMWAARRTVDGQWEACTGMAYSLDGSGVFDPAAFAIHNGESIHLHGPSRATGVPAIAGLIMHEEIAAGHIAHKLAFAIKASGLLAHFFPPTIWTDGGLPGGLPAGVILQLDPAFDVDQSGLTPGARVVARALQEYGAALVDFAHGFTLYGEGLWSDPHGRSWTGWLEEEAIFGLGVEHFRYLAPGNTGQVLVEKGMVPFPHDSITKVYREHTGIPILA